MHIALTKHHGLGNDFLVCDVTAGVRVADWPGFARRVCSRTTGIGADGLLLLTVESPSSLVMKLYNSDGSVAEMSGNGIRCLVQAAHESLGAGVGQTYRVSTDAGVREATVVSDDSKGTIDVRVDMGEVGDLPEPANWSSLECDPLRPVRHLSLGNPHSVVGVEDVAVVDLARLGALVPQVNLEIVEPGPGTDGITLRVHERGAGITSACGTGACAGAFAAREWGIVPASVNEVVVHMDGGRALVSIEGRRAVLTGPATRVASVSVDA